MGYTYAGQIFFDTKTLEIATAEDDGAKVLSYRIVETLGGSHGHWYVQRGIVVEPIAIDTDLFSRQ